MIKRIKALWKRANTNYWYKYDSVEDMFDGNRTIYMEYYDPFYEKIYRWIYFSGLCRSLRGLRNWFRFRLWDRYHYAWTGLEPGYHDPDTQIEGVLFQAVRDYIEKYGDKDVIEWASKPYKWHTMWDGCDEEEIRGMHKQYGEIIDIYRKIKDNTPWELETNDLDVICHKIIDIRGILCV